MQLCEQGDDETQVFGVIATSNGTFASIQRAIQSWMNATCLSFSDSTKFAGSAKLIIPLATGNDTDITPLVANRLAGTNVRPQANADGSCKTYQVQADDDCSSLAAQYSLKIDDLKEFNKNTWGWSGCHPLFKDTIMCLSEGTPPFPAEIPNAMYGPQKPGTNPPTDGSDIAKLNLYPLNTCCNIWGQYRITHDFCIDTNVGPPGTAALGTYRYISNYGMDVVKGSGSGGIRLGYF